MASACPSATAPRHLRRRCQERKVRRGCVIADAIACFERAIAADPKSSKAHLKLGNTLVEWGRRDDALESYRTALSLDPEYAAAHNNLANLLQERGHLREAETHLRTALAQRPKS